MSIFKLKLLLKMFAFICLILVYPVKGFSAATFTVASSNISNGVATGNVDIDNDGLAD